MTFTALIIIVLFGIFLILVGVLMLFNPEKARGYLRKAGSTSLINYSEITVRMIPAAALVIYSDYSRFPEILNLLGWFMIVTSLVLYFVPRHLHHSYALMSADILTPNLIRIASPFSVLFWNCHYLFCDLIETGRYI
jgi:hypothetical protein